jgi:uncharacterized membrane protein required for colicin V production
MTWPDIVIGAILLLAALRGFKTGLVAEVGGVLALVAAVWGTVTYRGALDATIVNITSMSPGTAHVIGAIATGAGAFAFVALVSAVANRFASLQIVGIANALGGALAGLLKGLVFVWVLLFAALFFPIGAGARADIKSSLLGSLLLAPNAFVDAQLEANVPPFARPFAEPVLRAHDGASPRASAMPS